MQQTFAIMKRKKGEEDKKGKKGQYAFALFIRTNHNTHNLKGIERVSTSPNAFLPSFYSL